MYYTARTASCNLWHLKEQLDDCIPDVGDDRIITKIVFEHQCSEPLNSNGCSAPDG